MGVEPDRTGHAAIAHRAGDVSHDLKTPLNIITLNSELLKMKVGDDADSRIVEYCRAIEGEARRIATVVDSFFSLFALAEGGGARPVTLLEPLGLEDAAPEGNLMMSEEAAAALGALLARSFPTLFASDDLSLMAEREGDLLRVQARGRQAEGVEIGRALKFYYTDASGAPAVELATARILSEMAGGSLELDISTTPMTLTLEIPVRDE